MLNIKFVGVITSVIIQLTFTNSQSAVQPDCNAIYYGLDGYVPGRCVTFHECPPLKGLLKGNSLTAAELKLLHNLTCTIDEENPTICCALNDILDLSNYKDGPKNSGKHSSSLHDIIIYPSTNSDQYGNRAAPKPNLILQNGAERLKPSVPNILPGITHPRPSSSSENARLKRFSLLPKLDECGMAAVDTTLRIVGGKNAIHGAWPWMARIGYEHLDTGEIEFFCGATVISHKYILTAAHCSEEVDKSEMRIAVVRLGEHNTLTDFDCSPDAPTQVNCSQVVDMPIDKVIHHPGYNLDNKTNDIELIRVKGKIPFNTPFVKPVCLPFVKEYGIESYIKEDEENPDQFVGKTGVVTGWGRTKWNKADGSELLQKVSLPIVGNEECQRNYSTKITLWHKQMCAGGNVDEDSCGGDSGGPITVPVNMRFSIQNRHSSRTQIKVRPKFFQLGVVSFGPTHCGVGGLPGVYTRISAYKDWILDSLEP